MRSVPRVHATLDRAVNLAGRPVRMALSTRVGRMICRTIWSGQAISDRCRRARTEATSSLKLCDGATVVQPTGHGNGQAVTAGPETPWIQRFLVPSKGLEPVASCSEAESLQKVRVQGLLWPRRERQRRLRVREHGPCRPLLLMQNLCRLRQIRRKSRASQRANGSEGGALGSRIAGRRASTRALISHATC